MVVTDLCVNFEGYMYYTCTIHVALSHCAVYMRTASVGEASLADGHEWPRGVAADFLDICCGSMLY